jgi:hypothetical protein
MYPVYIIVSTHKFGAYGSNSMVLKIRIGSGIGKLSVNSESDESVRIGRIGSETRIFFSKNTY